MGYSKGHHCPENNDKCNGDQDLMLSCIRCKLGWEVHRSIEDTVVVLESIDRLLEQWKQDPSPVYHDEQAGKLYWWDSFDDRKSPVTFLPPSSGAVTFFNCDDSRPIESIVRTYQEVTGVLLNTNNWWKSHHPSVEGAYTKGPSYWSWCDPYKPSSSTHTDCAATSV